MWHIAIFGDDLEALDCFCVADDIIEVDGAVLFYPVQVSAFATG